MFPITTTTTPSRATNNNILIDCPFCSRAISINTISIHIATQHEEEQEQRVQQPNTTKRQRHDDLIVPAKPPNTPRLVSCPICCKTVSANIINIHLDTSCTGSQPTPSSSPHSSTLSPIPGGPPGLYIIHNFITADEEIFILRNLDALKLWQPSTFSGQCESMAFGRRLDWSRKATRAPDPARGEIEIPTFLQFIIERFQQYAPLQCWFPNNGNCNRYRKHKGDFLRPHHDDRQLGGEIIVNVSLLNDCVMTFSKPNTTLSHRVDLPRLSASVMTRQARWDFQHAIAAEDFVGEGDERMSLNFRQAPP